MKAILSKQPGGPGTLVMDELPTPAPAEGEIRIVVKSVGLNFPDLLIIEDKYQVKPDRPFAPGAEVAGVIDAVGHGVSAYSVGERVVAMLGWGGLAQKVVVPVARVSKIPNEMPYNEAAALLMAFGTSSYALKIRAALQFGETLLVLGAAGGVGLAAVELGKAMGANVVAATSSKAKLDVALEAGANSGIVYPAHQLEGDEQKALTAQFKEACEPKGAAVIYDPVGGYYTEPALRSIAWEGRYLVVGFPAGVCQLPLNLCLLKSCDVRGVFWGAAIERDPFQHQQAIQELLALYNQGQIRPRVHQVFPFAQAGEALKVLASRTSTGKIVVEVDN